MPRTLRIILPVILLSSLIGCDSSDARVTQMAEQQARQNDALAQQHQQIASATRTLIEADKQSRDDFAAMAQQLQEERSGIHKGRDELEAERREIAGWRQRDPVVADALLNLGFLIACLLPFLVCIYALRAASTGVDDPQVLNEVLIAELVSEKPLLPGHGLLRIEEARPPETESS